MPEKPTCELIGTDGNIFALAGKVCKSLRKAKLYKEEEEFRKRLLDCKSYDEALQLVMEYVEVE
jgi:hypothetical protein